MQIHAIGIVESKVRSCPPITIAVLRESIIRLVCQTSCPLLNLFLHSSLLWVRTLGPCKSDEFPLMYVLNDGLSEEVRGSIVLEITRPALPTEPCYTLVKKITRTFPVGLHLLHSVRL